MEGLPLVQSMVFYAVDPDPTTGKRNKDLLTILEITSTPTVYYNNKKYAGKSAFELVQQLKGHGVQRQQQQPMARVQQQRMVQQPQQMVQQQIPQQQPHQNSDDFNLTADFGGDFGGGMSHFNASNFAEGMPHDMHHEMPRAANTRNSDDMMSVEKALEMAMKERQYS